MAIETALHRHLASTALPSYCTAHPVVIDMIFADAREHDSRVLIEATCNQVNQEGGYTGLTPQDFAARIGEAADRTNLSRGRIILGGDHLGPNPWRQLPADEAMARAAHLVRDYAAAGFEKIHLDASMALGGDPVRLPPEAIAERAADLCAVAEAAATKPPVYVIGTEVPVPGGEIGGLGAVAITRPEDLAATLDLHRAAFARRGLNEAFDRVVAVVAQPGVDFDQADVLPFAPERVAPLAAALAAARGIIGEAHSTDYQSAEALRALVEARFAVLKVGPELTFAYREAMLALAALEREVVLPADRSNLREVLLERMRDEPAHWQNYYEASDVDLEMSLLYSLSDRIRYYWPDPVVVRAVERLLANLRGRRVPAPVWHQFLPLDNLDATSDPSEAVHAAIVRVLRRYRAACTV